MNIKHLHRKKLYFETECNKQGVTNTETGTKMREIFPAQFKKQTLLTLYSTDPYVNIYSF